MSVGVTRDVAVTELPIRGIAINSATSTTNTFTLVGSDSGIIFVNKDGTATQYNLPAVAEGAGKMFWFFAGYAANIVVYGPAASTIYGDGSLGRTLTGTGAIGLSCMVIGDGDYYYAFEIYGTWNTT